MFQPGEKVALNRRAAAHRLFAFSILLCVNPSPLKAQQNAWMPVTRADVDGSPNMAMRDPATLNLTAIGDFDGDGGPDRAYIEKNEASSQFRVVACLAQRTGPCVEQIVRYGRQADIRSLGISTVSRESVRLSLTRSGRRHSLNLLDQSIARDLLDVFTFESSMTVFVWTHSRFDPVEVMD